MTRTILVTSSGDSRMARMLAIALGATVVTSAPNEPEPYRFSRPDPGPEPTIGLPKHRKRKGRGRHKHARWSN